MPGASGRSAIATLARLGRGDLGAQRGDRLCVDPALLFQPGDKLSGLAQNVGFCLGVEICVLRPLDQQACSREVHVRVAAPGERKGGIP